MFAPKRPQPSQTSKAARPLRLLPDSPFASSVRVQAAGPGFDKWAIGDETANDELSFGPFRLFPEQRLLFEADKAVRIGSRALDILIAMVERSNQLVGKDELMARVWPNLHVEPNNLTVHVAALRRLLGDGRNGNRFLVNIPGRGYRFVAAVSRAGKPISSGQPAITKCVGNLPAQLTRLVGRAGTLSILAERLAKERLLTVVGPGGIGKSSVALAVAEDAGGIHAHGAWQVDLACLSDASQIPGAIGAALGLDNPGGNATASLPALLRDRNMVLVLDNCEHVVGAAASIATSILRGAPGVRILATSREPLRAEGEHRYRLTSLEVPPGSRPLGAAEALGFSAVDLFVRCAAATSGGFELKDADVPFIVGICRRLDGIPLAIEFAASLIDTFGVSGLARRLKDGLQALTGGYRTALPRHQTLRSMLDWSYDWLPETERIILRRLSILNGDFTLERAIAVAANDDIESCGVADGIAGLVAKSLVVADVAGKEPVYRMLETTRAYALEKLRGSGEPALSIRDRLDPPGAGFRI